MCTYTPHVVLGHLTAFEKYEAARVRYQSRVVVDFDAATAEFLAARAEWDAYQLDAVDIAEDGQLSLGVPGEQIPLDGLAPNRKEEPCST